MTQQLYSDSACRNPIETVRSDSVSQPLTGLRVLFLTVVPSPYIDDMFRAMRCDGRIEPHVLYMERQSPAFPWLETALPDYAEYLSGRWYGVFGARVHWNPGVMRRIQQIQPDVVVIAGYSSATTQVVMRRLNRSKIPWVFWGEVPGIRKVGVLGRWMRSLAQKPMKGCAAIAAIGSVAQQAYAKSTEKAQRVVNIPYCCDTSAFDAPRRSKSGSDIAGGVRFLFCGQLIHRKGVDLLVSAFSDVARTHPLASLVLVGQGEMEHQLKSMVPEELKARVQFAGFRQVEDLPSFFQAADVFVLPSRHDGWGVVVNQALGAGLAVVCSDRVGAAADLIEEGGNGYVVKADDVAGLTASLKQFAEHPGLAEQFGRRSTEILRDWTPQRIVDRWYSLFSDLIKVSR